MVKKYGGKSNNTNGFKQHDTIVFQCQYIEDDSDEPVSVEGITIISDMNDSDGNLICKLNIFVIDAINGIFTLNPTIKTLPVGSHDIDIVFRDDSGSLTASDTFHVNIEKSETNPYRGT